MIYLLVALVWSILIGAGLWWWRRIHTRVIAPLTAYACDDCGGLMAPTPLITWLESACPGCGKVVCPKCWDPLTGACLRCPAWRELHPSHRSRVGERGAQL